MLTCSVLLKESAHGASGTKHVQTPVLVFVVRSSPCFKFLWVAKVIVFWRKPAELCNTLVWFVPSVCNMGMTSLGAAPLPVIEVRMLRRHSVTSMYVSHTLAKSKARTNFWENCKFLLLPGKRYLSLFERVFVCRYSAGFYSVLYMFTFWVLTQCSIAGYCFTRLVHIVSFV